MPVVITRLNGTETAQGWGFGVNANEVLVISVLPVADANGAALPPTTAATW